MIALADCNIFFASVERALHPGLKGKPVCVLSSNDGNIVALTAEAKALGLKRGMVSQIALWTDIPVSVGIAKTKTLAKIASKFAKQYKGYGGVCMIDTDEKRRKALSMFDLADVWGIGPRSFAKLSSLALTQQR